MSESLSSLFKKEQRECTVYIQSCKVLWNSPNLKQGYTWQWHARMYVHILHLTTPHIYHPSQHPEHTQHTSSIELLFNVPKNVFSLLFSNIMNLHNNNSCIACHNTNNSYYPIRTCCVAERCIYLYFIYLFIYLFSILSRIPITNHMVHRSSYNTLHTTNYMVHRSSYCTVPHNKTHGSLTISWNHWQDPVMSLLTG